MCDGPAASPDFYDERTVRARKPHRCYACHETIRKGDQHRQIAGKWEGEFASFRHCMRCHRICVALHERERTLDAYEQHEDGIALDLACGEIWKSPPPEVEALAFALPTDFQQGVSP